MIKLLNKISIFVTTTFNSNCTNLSENGDRC